MSRDNISSGELDRRDVIAACLDVEKRILDARHEKREALIRWYMGPVSSGIVGRWFKMKPIVRTREEAEKLADQDDGMFGPEHAWMHGVQLGLAQQIRSIAEASQATTIRVTREDFGSIRSGWDNVAKAKAAQPQKTINELYPGAECDTCGWFGPRSELVEVEHDGLEHCPDCKSSRTNWLDEEQFEEAKKENAE